MNRSTWQVALALVGIVGGIELTACPPAYQDLCDNHVCDPVTAIDGGADGDGSGTVVVPPDDSFAVFVDGENGSDANDGTRAKPLKKIGDAVAMAKIGKNQIYVCGSGIYAEHIKLTNAVGLHGGFACNTWTADSSARPKVAPTDNGYALQIDNVTDAVAVSDLEFDAADASGMNDGTSSIAVFANKAKNVSFLRVTLSASNGADGADGQTGTQGAITAVSSGTNDAIGNSNSGATGAAAKQCTCSSSPTATKGGAGGSDSGGGNGQPNYGASTPNDGAGGAGGGNCNIGGNGHTGADAPPATNAPAIAKRGELTTTGWAPTSGADATENGKPGQGGGGGGAVNTSVGGAGGGCGGCGGFPGKGGGGAGSSIALLVNETTVTLTSSSLSAQAGGAGGKGGAGGAGAAGGAGGGGACTGGTGGRGADGGSGAGGAGGVSVGILYKGTPPTVDGATTIVPHASGAAGKGGKSPDNDGPPGVSEKIKDAAEL